MADHIEELVRVGEGHSSELNSFVPESWRHCMDHHQLDPLVLRPAVIVEDRQPSDHHDAMEEQLRGRAAVFR